MVDDPESVDATDPSAVVVKPRGGDRLPRPWARPRTTRRLAVVGVVLIAAVGFLLYKGLSSALVYFKTTSEAVAARSQLGNTTFQLEGIVVRGSVRQLVGGRVAFTVEGGGAQIPVVNTGEPPQLFRAGIAVVVVGHFVGTSNDFASDQILVKHSNQYIAAHPGRVTVPVSDTGPAPAGQPNG